MTAASAPRHGISAADLAAVRRAARLAEVVTPYLAKVKRNGRGELTACCPFHDERTPSFVVYRDHYHCYGCGAHGDAIAFVMARDGLDFPGAVRELAARFGVLLGGVVPAPSAPAPRPKPPAGTGEGQRAPARLPDHAAEVWQEAKPLTAGDPAWLYLEARGLSPEQLQPWLAALRCHAALPYFHDGRLLCRAPAMVAAIQGQLGRILGLHRTWLGEGGKLVLSDPGDPGRTLPAKRMLGAAAGGAIRFGPAAPRLYLGEGIETTLSALHALLEAGREGCGERWSAWALGSLGNFAGRGLEERRRRPHPQRPGFWLPTPLPDPGGSSWRPPEGTREVVWLMDNDGKDPLAAEMLLRRGAARLEAQGIAVTVARPPRGQDFNDLWRGRR